MILNGEADVLRDEGEACDRTGKIFGKADADSPAAVMTGLSGVYFSFPAKVAANTHTRSRYG